MDRRAPAQHGTSGPARAPGGGFLSSAARGRATARTAARLLGVVVATSWLASLPAFAQEAPAGCLTPAADLDAALRPLTEAGWTALPDGTLPGEVAGRLVWLYVADYTTGDSGGETLATILALQERTVKALAVKRDIPGSKTRILTSGEDAMILMWRAPAPATVELDCRVALSGGAAGPGFRVEPARRVPHGHVYTTHVDAEALSAQTGLPVPGTLIDTALSYPSEVTR